jgi:drug/metabolite transporter (DMT)-like permease
VNQLILIAAMAFAALMGSLGQLALKRLSGIPVPLMMFSWFAWAFVATYGVAVIINLWVYRSGASVSVAYPIIATSYIWAALLAWRFLGEPISRWSIAGICCIVLGVGLIGWGAAA